MLLKLPALELNSFSSLVNVCETAEEAKREAAEKEREVLRQREQEMQQKMEAQERSFQENIAQLKEKMEREREDLLREQERMLEHKLKVSLGAGRCPGGQCSGSWEGRDPMSSTGVIPEGT